MHVPIGLHCTKGNKADLTLSLNLFEAYWLLTVLLGDFQYYMNDFATHVP